MRLFLKWFILCLVVTVISFFLMRFLVKLQGITLSIHGEIAMIIGVFFTMALGCGLMALIFHSNRAGHDQAVHDQSKKEGE